MSGIKSRRKWALMVENADEATDPKEVVYCVALVDGAGKIYDTDGRITGMDHGWQDRLRKAMAAPLLKLKRTETRVAVRATAKIVVVLALVLVATTSCADADGARRALMNAGYSDIRTDGYAWLGCGRDDVFATKFEATGPTGLRVSGVVCSAWFKGATIRTF